MGENKITGRTLYDLLYELLHSVGMLRVVLVIFVLFTTVLAISHWQTAPGDDVKLMGLILYTKSQKNEDNSNPRLERDELLNVNLVKNGGAEADLQFWDTSPGYSVRNADPSAYKGLNYFFPGANKGTVVASQSIDLTKLSYLIDKNRLVCEVSGYMRNYENKDQSQLVVEFSDMNGNLIETVASPIVAQAYQWLKYSEVKRIVSGVKMARVILRSTYRHGANNNDGYFDEIGLSCSEN